MEIKNFIRQDLSIEFFLTKFFFSVGKYNILKQDKKYIKLFRVFSTDIGHCQE